VAAPSRDGIIQAKRGGHGGPPVQVYHFRRYLKTIRLSDTKSQNFLCDFVPWCLTSYTHHAWPYQN